jgi:4,5-dihydroxyphthalate decarboxylase
MNPLSLTLALGAYDHTRDVTEGGVPVEGVALRTLRLPLEEIFYRFIVHREFDVSEMSMGKYIAFRSRADCPFTALPVFVSRAFRHSMFYVRQGSAITRPEDLAGKRIGVPEWAQTAGIYARGYLSDYLAIDLSSIAWVQAGVNQPGRGEKTRLDLPPGLRLTALPERCLNDLLLAGEIDAIVSARPPAGLGRGIARLMPDYEALEERYFQDTGIYPVMHGLVARREVFEKHPWVAMNLYQAFVQAKNQSLERLSDITASHAPFAWLANYSARMQALFGDDFFPYGVDASPGGALNRRTLAAFCRFGFEQGVCERLLDVDELFPANVRSSVRV